MVVDEKSSNGTVFVTSKMLLWTNTLEDNLPAIWLSKAFDNKFKKNDDLDIQL